MHDFQRILGERVKIERKKRGLTQKQLADLVHSNKRTILDIENSRGNPKLETLISIFSYLEIDPYTIFFPEPPTRSEALTQLEKQLHDCSEEQIQILASICKNIIEFSEAKEHIGAY
jgi:transcriptional regulator with XRE-family HTH domain